MVGYNYDGNNILAETMKSREEQELIRATAEIHKQLTDAGLKPQFQVLDNECPLGLKTWLKQQDVGFQLVPPPYTPTKCLRKGNINIQRSFHINIVRHRQKLSNALMVSHNTTSGKNIKHVTTIKN